MNQELSSKLTRFSDLNAWKEGHELVLMIYKITKCFPREEMFGLVSQMRRAAVSITSNIAEGFSRQSYKDKINFYTISQGSVTELQNQLRIAKDVGYIKETEFKETAHQSIKVHKITNGLIKGARQYAKA